MGIKVKLYLWLAGALFAVACQPPLQQAEVQEEYPEPDRQFDLNAVTYDELITIDGMRKDVARNIIDFQKGRRFRRVEDILAVDRIGEKTFLLLRRHFYVAKD